MIDLVFTPIIIEANTLGEAWQKSVVALMEKGYDRFIQAPDYSTHQKDAPVFIMVKTPLEEPRIHSKAPVQRDRQDEYANNVIFGMKDRNTENSFDYTYFGRFRCYPDCEVRADWPNVIKDGEVEETMKKLCNGKCVVRVMDQVHQLFFRHLQDLCLLSS